MCESIYYREGRIKRVMDWLAQEAFAPIKKEDTEELTYAWELYDLLKFSEAFKDFGFSDEERITLVDHAIGIAGVDLDEIKQNLDYRFRLQRFMGHLE